MDKVVFITIAALFFIGIMVTEIQEAAGTHSHRHISDHPHYQQLHTRSTPL